MSGRIFKILVCSLNIDVWHFRVGFHLKKAFFEKLFSFRSNLFPQFCQCSVTLLFPGIENFLGRNSASARHFLIKVPYFIHYNIKVLLWNSILEVGIKMTPFLASFCNFVYFFQVFEFDSGFLHKFFEIVDRIGDEKSVSVQFRQSFFVSLIDERGSISL